MKEKKIMLEINCPPSKIFEFTLNPNNTHLWVDNIVQEETNESPTRIETEYKNLNKQDKWTVYEIVRLESNEMFEMKQKNGLYHVRYTFEPVSDNKTKLTYFEWVDEGELEEPFSLAILQKLKEIVEKQSTKMAKDVIEKILYITIATSNKEGVPWNSPVYSAYDESYNFYWASYVENQHSKNIRANQNVFIVIYDSTVPEGTGFGVYMEGKAYQLDKDDVEEIKHAIKLLSERVNKKPRSPEEFLEGFPRRIFKFVPEKIWVNSEGEIKGNYVDTRIDITDAILKT